jgi:hypothetical protein
MDRAARRADDRSVIPFRVVLATVVALVVLTAPAQAAWTGDVGSTQAVLTGDSSLDLLQIGTSGNYLSHSPAGPGFASALDWNSSPAITETIPLAAQIRVVIEGGDGDDLVRVGDDTYSANDVPFPFTFKGGDGTDSVIVDASKETVNRYVSIDANSLEAGLQFDNTVASFRSQSVENTVVLMGSGNDMIQVSGTNPSDPISVDGGGGNDTARVTGLTALRGEFAFSGSAGDDTLAVSDATATVPSVTDIDDGGLHRGSGTARPAFGVERQSFVAGSGADSVAKSGGHSWSIDGGAGDDSVVTRDAVGDSVTCGAGADFAVSDPLDALGDDCERSDRVVAGDGGVSGGGSAGDTGGGGGGAGGSGPGASDTTAPAIVVAGLPKKPLRVRTLLRGLKPKLSTDEPASFQVQLLGSARRVSLARAYDLTLAKAALPVGGGIRSVKLKPARKLVGRARRFSVRVVVTAVDAAGNRSVATRTLRVKR